MGKNSYDEILRDLITHTGLDVGERQVRNQSIRPSSANIQVCIRLYCSPFYHLQKFQLKAGMTQEQMRLINGHINPRTIEIYLRNNPELMAEFGGNIQSVATGSCISYDYAFVNNCVRIEAG